MTTSPPPASLTRFRSALRGVTASALLIASTAGATPASFKLSSPDGTIVVTMDSDGSRPAYAVTLDGETVVARSPIGLRLRDRPVLGEVVSTAQQNVRSEYRPVVPRKSRVVRNAFNELTLTFGSGVSLLLRAYDDGVAYRWRLNADGDHVVEAETATFAFEEDARVWWPVAKGFETSHEPRYEVTRLSELPADGMAFCGTLVAVGDTCRVLISESDLQAYPGMMLAPGDGGTAGDAAYAIKAEFAAYPTVVAREDTRYYRVKQRADEIARVFGPRELPWRVLVVTRTDAELAESQLIDKLSPECRIEDPSWVRPGRVAWDWWNDLNLHGVEFEAGVNTETYLHYIDFAAENGLEYVILDEGWTVMGDLTDYNPAVDVRAIIAHANKRDVGVILWALWRDLLVDLEGALDRFAEWGVAGLKIDFIDRDDQLAVESVWEIARLAADRRMVVDYHGCYKPAGLRRAYPNALTREGVLGLEVVKWDTHVTPAHDLILPFTRQVLGPMDYTPGAMRNVHPKSFHASWSRPMSQGTRCHQLAMYVCYESPLQMLCDSPSNYRGEPESLAFIRAAPTVWDETHVLAAAVGEHLAVARRSGQQWFVGAIAGAEAKQLRVRLPLPTNSDWRARIWADGPNAQRHAEDVAERRERVSATSELTIDMAPGGGWVAIIEPVEVAGAAGRSALRENQTESQR